MSKKTETLTGDSDTLDLVRIAFDIGEAPPLDENLCTTLVERHNVHKVSDVIYCLQGGGVHKVDALVAGLCKGFSQTAFDAVDGELRAEAFAVARRLPPAPAVGVPTSSKIPAWAFNSRRGNAPLVSRGLPVALGVEASKPEPLAKKPRSDETAGEAGVADKPKAAPEAAGSAAEPKAAAEPRVPEPETAIALMGVPPSAALSAGMSDVEQQVSIPVVRPEPLALSHTPDPGGCNSRRPHSRPPEPPPPSRCRSHQSTAISHHTAATLSALCKHPSPVMPGRCLQVDDELPIYDFISNVESIATNKINNLRVHVRLPSDQLWIPLRSLQVPARLPSARLHMPASCVLCSLSDCFERKLPCCGASHSCWATHQQAPRWTPTPTSRRSCATIRCVWQSRLRSTSSRPTSCYRP